MRYIRRYGFTAVVVITCLFPFVFYSSDLSTHKELSVVEKIVFTIGRPIELIFSNLTLGIKKGVNSYSDLINAKEELEKAKEENFRLKVYLQAFREMENENLRLKNLLDFVQRLKLNFISAEILSADPSFLYKNVRLNRGEPAGVMSGMGVVAADGAVGVVIRSDKLLNYSDVLLITDPNSNLDVIVARNRRRGVLSGKSSNKMILRNIGRGGKIQVGDEIVTSGLSGPFPRGISVGIVIKVDGDDASNIMQSVEVEPSVNYSQLSEVLVLKHPNREVDIIRKIGGDEWMNEILRSNPDKGGG